jgi:hypothetical protein
MNPTLHANHDLIVGIDWILYDLGRKKDPSALSTGGRNSFIMWSWEWALRYSMGKQIFYQSSIK